LQAPMDVMSGGELARARLAAIALSRQDFLLLDEPTNDLDFQSQDLLDDLVEGTSAGLVVVSHDRAFLDRALTDVVELDHLSHRVTVYSGGWADYLLQQQRDRELQHKRHETYLAERERIIQMMHRKREWSRKGTARAKSQAPDNNKAARYRRRESAQNLAQGAKALSKRLERLEKIDEPVEGWELHYSIANAPRSGDIVAQMRQLCVRRDAFQLGPLDLDIAWADRIALLGPNGSGKTTLLGALLDSEKPDEGTVRLGAGTVVGSLDQTRKLFRRAPTLLEGMERVSQLTVQDLRSLLAKFDLTASDLDRPACDLSPGEHTRAELAVLMSRGVNTLLLDEPTNHLDLPAIDQLQQALEVYPGTLLLVTHDRVLLEGVRLTRQLQLVIEHDHGRRISHLRESL
jgi:ATPase subunit of ABC transporter with duplicated ATPase domains